MACTCVEWNTGRSHCIGPVSPNTVETCRTHCRQQGMGILCFASFGDCDRDTCNTGMSLDISVAIAIQPAQPMWIADIIVRRCCSYGPGQYESCRNDALVQTLANFKEALRTNPGIVAQILGRPLSPEEMERFLALLYVGVVSFLPVSSIPCSQRATPCCYPDRAHPATTLCAFIEPAECLRRCGQFFEGEQWAEDPCRLVGDLNPCNIHPCCRLPYPHPPSQQDLDAMGGAYSYGVNGRYCRNGTLSYCAGVGGVPNLDARSCYAPESCDKTWIEGSLHCVRGDWVATYRTTSPPPLEKPWLDGSAEIVSEQPERAVTPIGGPQDCKNHYGDVIYPFVEPGVSADAMGAICSTRANRSLDSVHASCQYKAQNLCPVFYGPDGNARFRCEYRVA